LIRFLILKTDFVYWQRLRSIHKTGLTDPKESYGVELMALHEPVAEFFYVFLRPNAQHSSV
jgi:hypothetical protein